MILSVTIETIFNTSLFINIYPYSYSTSFWMIFVNFSAFPLKKIIVRFIVEKKSLMSIYNLSDNLFIGLNDLLQTQKMEATRKKNPSL